MTVPHVPATEAGREHLDYIRRWSEDEGATWTDFDTEELGGRIRKIEQQARDEGRQEANIDWNSKEGTVWHYECRTEDAYDWMLRAMPFIQSVLIMADDKTPALALIADAAAIKERHDRPTGLNASESPPTEPVLHVGDVSAALLRAEDLVGYRFIEGIEHERAARALIRALRENHAETHTASDDPDWMHEPGSPDMHPDRGTIGGASESGQPPDWESIDQGVDAVFPGGQR